LIRRRGHTAESALDRTQDYFARLLERGTIALADPTRGRFRAFLRADCLFFLADRHDRDGARKRGGRPPLSIDAALAEGRFATEPADDRTPGCQFDRAWALALIDATLAALAAHDAATGRATLFEATRPAPSAGPDAAPHAEVARALGTTPGAVQVALSRMRARFAAALRERIAATLDDPTPEVIADEITDLFAALGR
jgi:RNA polymerase sigma-70 factor (ECF subfamily)